ncbi:hypothetical protein HG531_004675 [Fusarium graminearum]|nr:hypothetical protein HG531_004675 [Fusarium graminearum]
MVSAIPRRHDTRTPEKPRKLSNPRLKGDKLIVRLKLRPSILAQFPTKTKPLEKKPTTKPLIREHNAHQLQFLDQLISEQSTELNRLNQERSITMQNIENYERVCSMHLDTLHRSLADACDLGMTSCELKDGDGDSTRLLKDDIQQMRQGVQNWSRILMEAKQDLASKKHQITMIATSLKTLEEERQQLSQWINVTKHLVRLINNLIRQTTLFEQRSDDNLDIRKPLLYVLDHRRVRIRIVLSKTILLEIIASHVDVHEFEVRLVILEEAQKTLVDPVLDIENLVAADTQV